MVPGARHRNIEQTDLFRALPDLLRRRRLFIAGGGDSCPQRELCAPGLPVENHRSRP